MNIHFRRGGPSAYLKQPVNGIVNKQATTYLLGPTSYSPTMSGYSGYVTSLFSSNSSNQPPRNQNQYNQPPNQSNTSSNPSLPALNYPTSAQPTNTASSTSSWTASLSTRLANLRKGLTAFSADERDDPDSEDSSHVSTVLRAYYIEKGRPFPPWLPPDPKQPSPQPVVRQQQSSYGAYAGYGASQNAYGQPQRDTAAGGGGLTDLFGNSSRTSPTPPVSASQSLRNRPGRRPVGQSPDPNPGSSPLEQPQPLSSRLLPNQIAGSYQQQGNVGSGNGFGSRDRLRARLQGGGSGRNSPIPAMSPGGGDGGDSYFGQPGQGSGSGGYGQSAYGGAGGNDGEYAGGYGRGGYGAGDGGHANGPAPTPAATRRQPPSGIGLPSGPRLKPGGQR